MATLFEKLWNSHIVTTEENRDLLYIDRHYIHEVTSPQAFSGIKMAGRKIRRPDRIFATMDHNVPTTAQERLDFLDPQAKLQVETLAENCKNFGIELAEMGTANNGIVHIVGPEMGLSYPGQTIVCGDSHTATHGAFANLAFGIGTSEVEHVFATQTLWQTRPKTLGIKLTGKLDGGVSAKDVILKLIAENGVAFGTGYALEFYGEAVEKMSMDERMTMCNMAIEAGAKYGMVAYDMHTKAYLENTEKAASLVKNAEIESYFQTLKTDDEAEFDKIISLDLMGLAPQITWGTNPGQGIAIDGIVPTLTDSDTLSAYEYMDVHGGMSAMDFPVDYIFIGSCTNGRLSDLIEGAKYLRGRRVADGVRAIVVPGSEKTRMLAEEKGIAKLYTDAGFEWRLPGCSACLGMNTDQIPAGMHCISTSNRNFVGRQGYKARTHLASVQTAVLAAVHGKIVDVRKEQL
ncbi:3-isopropylmalate dehydratase large subunit [Erysipelotrichaceae bacterium]|nr:3-isopropylmalate dehydratase large subunit [Erysipelotrichaceae bacterium]